MGSEDRPHFWWDKKVGCLEDHPSYPHFKAMTKRPFGRGPTTPGLGDLLSAVISHLLNGMILQVPTIPKWQGRWWIGGSQWRKTGRGGSEIICSPCCCTNYSWHEAWNAEETSDVFWIFCFFSDTEMVQGGFDSSCTPKSRCVDKGNLIAISQRLVTCCAANWRPCCAVVHLDFICLIRQLDTYIYIYVYSDRYIASLVR